MINQARDFIWGPWMLALFLGMGIFYTVKSGFFQIRGLPVWLKSTIGSLGEREEGGGITKFQTACTALAATIGTGNIVGVATALTAGGPGAIFWMWISAAIGMMTAYGETALGIRYRYRDENGQWVCGPMVYLERGMKKQWLALMYAFDFLFLQIEKQFGHNPKTEILPEFSLAYGSLFCHPLSLHPIY